MIIATAVVGDLMKPFPPPPPSPPLPPAEPSSLPAKAIMAVFGESRAASRVSSRTAVFLGSVVVYKNL
jgi:hypothetical protein